MNNSLKIVHYCFLLTAFLFLSLGFTVDAADKKEVAIKAPPGKVNLGIDWKPPSLRALAP